MSFYVDPITFQETDIITVNLTFQTNVRLLRQWVLVYCRPSSAVWLRCKSQMLIAMQ